MYESLTVNSKWTWSNLGLVETVEVILTSDLKQF